MSNYLETIRTKYDIKDYVETPVIIPDLPDQDRLWVYEELLPIRDRFGFRSGA